MEMNLELFQTFSQIQQTIKNISQNIPCIGYSESHYPTIIDTQLRSYHEEMKDEGKIDCSKAVQELLKRNRLLETLKRMLFIVNRHKQVPYSVKKLYIPEFKIVLMHSSLDETIGPFELNEPERIPQILSKLSNLTYGDTKSNMTVQQGVALTYGVDWIMNDEEDLQHLIEAVSDLWETEMEIDSYTKVIAKPYKLNLYSSDGHFEFCEDTHSSDLIGTAIVVLNDTSDGKLTVDGHEVQAQVDLSSQQFPLVMFFSNTIHEVTKISSGYKCTFTFQIFRNNKEDSENKKLFRIDDTLVSLLKELVNTTTFQTLGFLFDSKYLFEPKSAWNNIEAIFMTFLQTLPKNEWKVQISPVLIRSNLTSQDANDVSSFDPEEDFVTQVFPCSDEEIQAMLHNTERSIEGEPPVKKQKLDSCLSRWNDIFNDRSKFQKVPFLFLDIPKPFNAKEDKDLQEEQDEKKEEQERQKQEELQEIVNLNQPKWYQHLKKDDFHKFALFNHENDECECTENEPTSNSPNSLDIHYGVIVQHVSCVNK